MNAQNGWKAVPLRDVCRVVEGQVDPREPEYRNLPHINGEVIESGTGRLLEVRTAAEDGLISGKYLFEPGMVLYSKLRPYLRKVTIAPSRGVCSADMYPLMFDPERVDSHFAMFSLLAEPFSTYAVEVSRRARMPKLNRAQLLAWEMPLPESLVDQRRIAVGLIRALAAIDVARRGAEDRLAAAEGLSAAYLREVFEGPDVLKWKVRALGELVQGSGQYGTSQRSNVEDRGLAVLGMPHIHQGRIRWQNVSTVDLDPDEIEKYELAAGDILFNRTNSAELVGKTAIFDGARRAVFASYLIRYRVIEDLADPHFICAYINSRRGREYVERHMARAIGQVNISASTMHRMPIPSPSLAEQRLVVSKLAQRSNATDILIDRCREELEAIEAMPGALLRSAFNRDS